MSQQKQLASYFKSCKRNNLPEQQAAKRRKVILQSHQIEQLLDSDEEEEVGPDHHEQSLSPGSVPVERPAKPPGDGAEEKEEFDDDEDWEDLANTTLDGMEAERVGSVTTSASDDHIWSRSEDCYFGSDADTVIISQPPQDQPSKESQLDYQSLIKTPKSASSSRPGPSLAGLSKTDARSHWTPPTLSQPLFTIGTLAGVVQAAQARKRLDWREKTEKARQNVVFSKLGCLALRKPAATRGLHYEALNLKLTPKLQSVVQPQPQASPVKLARKKVPDLTAAIEDAKKLEKKVSPAQIKSKLGKAKLKDLRSLLSGLEGSKLKAEVGRSKKVSSLQSPVKADILLELDVLQTPPQPTTPVKSCLQPASPRKVPAHQRYHSLAQPVNRNLPLPLLYIRLLEVFRCSDTVVSMMFNRQERITLDKLAKHTADMMNKRWEQKMLQQMMIVFPQAYNLRWRSKPNNSAALELVLEPNMNYKRDLKSLFDNTEAGARIMSGDLLVERRDMFRNSLVDIVKDHHEEFLASLDPPIDADRSKLTKWHKDFEIDLLPDIDLAEWPRNPQELTPATPEKNPALLSVNPRLGQILTDIDNGNLKPSRDERSLLSPYKFSSPSKAGLEGINPELIARVKAKEAAKAKLEMTRSPEEIARITTLKKLPNLARRMRSLFAIEKKAALEVEFTCKKISESLGSARDKKEIEKELRSLTEETDGWLLRCRVGAQDYFKTQKTDVNVICKMLEKRLEAALKS